jgi:hypothetical protein
MPSLTDVVAFVIAAWVLVPWVLSIYVGMTIDLHERRVARRIADEAKANAEAMRKRSL